MSEELRLCSCGAEIDPDNNPNRYTDEVLERNNWQVEWWVECDDCLCRGPIAGTPAEAVRLWNSRPIEHKLLAENEQLKGMLREWLDVWNDRTKAIGDLSESIKCGRGTEPERRLSSCATCWRIPSKSFTRWPTVLELDAGFRRKALFLTTTFAVRNGN
jgi:hypothetical protein